MRKYFADYLNEKITKKEFEDVLKNENILSGCEFEFYLEHDGYHSSEWDRIEEMISKCDKDLDKFGKRIRNYWSDYRVEERKYENAKDKADTLEEVIDELNDKKDELDEDDEKYQENYNTLKRSIDKRQKMLDDQLEIIRKWEDRETEEYLLIKHNPIPSLQNVSYLEDILDDLSEAGIIYFSTKDQVDEVNQYFWSMSMEEEEIPDFNDIITTIFNTTVHDVEQLYYDMGSNQIPNEQTLMGDLKFPVKIERGWEVKEDGSLSDGGMEISTGIYSVKKLIDIIEKVFKWIGKNGYTDNSCGFHVHLSMKSKNPIDPLKLILFVEEDKIYKEFEDRIGNSFAKSIKDAHINKLDLTIDDLRKLAKKEDIEKNMNLDKYLGLHLIDLKDNHVEFRYMGGYNYHKKFKEIRELIINYAFWLSIACDPDFKRNEYLTKAARLSNYYESSFYNSVVQKYESFLNTIESNMSSVRKLKNWYKITNLAIKPYRSKIKKLKNYKNYWDEADNLAKNILYEVLLYFDLDTDKKLRHFIPMQKYSKLSTFLKMKK
jgi:uncharacterized protein (DUF3820 family)